jgi:NADPH2:quinone reductase
MQAILQRRWGGPEALECVELDTPTPAADEVLIRVRRSGVNFDDAWTAATGISRFIGPLGEPPAVPGGEVVGVCHDTGSRVLALCGTGGYAQYSASPRARVYAVPDHIDDDTALALLVPGLTAWFLTQTIGALRAEQTVVIHAASGAVGSLAVQLARRSGAGRIIGTASTPAKRRQVEELGADVVIDSAADGLSDRLREANSGRPVDAILEMVGGAVFDQSLHALAPFGRIIVYGDAAGEPSALDSRELILGSRSVIGLWLMDHLHNPETVHHALAQLFSAVHTGALRVPTTTVYPLADAPAAQRDVARRAATGRVVLDPFR